MWSQKRPLHVEVSLYYIHDSWNMHHKLDRPCSVSTACYQWLSYFEQMEGFAGLTLAPDHGPEFAGQVKKGDRDGFRSFM